MRWRRCSTPSLQCPVWGVAEASAGLDNDALRDDVAVHRADLIRVAASDLDSARVLRTALRTAVRAADRDPDAVRVLLDVEVHLADSAADAAGEVAQLDQWTADTPAGLRHIGTPGTLRELLGAIDASGAADGVVLRPLAVPAAVGTSPRWLESHCPSAPCETVSASPARSAGTRPRRRTEGRVMTGNHASRSTSPRTSPASTTPRSGATRRPGSQIDFASFVHLAQHRRTRASSTSSSWPRGSACASTAGRIFDLDVVGPARLPHRARGARRRHRPARPGRHAQHHLQRALRAGPPVRRRSTTSAAAGPLERGHLARRVHRRELPPRRLPRSGAALRAGRRVHRRPRASCGTAGPTTPSWPTGGRRVRARRRRRPFAHDGAQFDIARPVQRAAEPAGPSRADPGRRLRRRAASSAPPHADVDLQPSRDLRRRAGSSTPT